MKDDIGGRCILSIVKGKPKDCGVSIGKKKNKEKKSTTKR